MGSISGRNTCLFILPCLVFFCCFCVRISYAQINITAGGSGMKDYQVLDSPNGSFRLKFFSPEGTSTHYLGIYHGGFVGSSPNAGYKWVANREHPLTDSSGVLSITQEGNMVLSDSNGLIITLYSKQPAMNNSSSSRNVTLSLLESGNLILKEGDQIVWQSSDYPSDTLLPGMKIGIFGLKTGSPQNKFLTSWFSPMIASAGAFTLGINPNNTTEVVIWRRGILYRRIGFWNGETFSKTDLWSHYNFNFSYHSNENESYYTISELHPVSISSPGSVWMTMNPTGSFDMYSEVGNVTSSLLSFSCDDKINFDDYVDCVPEEPSNCKRGDDFSQTIGNFWIGGPTLTNYSSSLSISDCKEICKKNCSCTAYTSASTDGTGCIFSDGQETSGFIKDTTFYIRKSTILDKVRPRIRRLLWLIISGSVVSLLVLSLLVGYLGRKNDCCFGFGGCSRQGVI